MEAEQLVGRGAHVVRRHGGLLQTRVNGATGWQSFRVWASAYPTCRRWSTFPAAVKLASAPPGAAAESRGDRARPSGRREPSRPATDRKRVAAAAVSRTDPRTTVPGQATFRPLQRRSW